MVHKGEFLAFAGISQFPAFNCFWDMTIAPSTGQTDGATGWTQGLTTVQMQTPAWSSGWDQLIWSFSNGVYPKFVWE